MINDALSTIGAPFVLLARTVRATRRAGLAPRAVAEQLVDLGTRTTALVVLGLSFFGLVMVTIAWGQARKYVGNITVVGPAYFHLILREFAPLIVAMLAASRAGAAISAELGAMSVNEQVEALELSAADPLAELVAPRLLASLLALPLLNVLGTVAATVAASMMVTYSLGADGSSFLDGRAVTWGDLSCAGLKTILFGTMIPLSAAVRGLSARGGAAAVGQAVTDGVVDACVWCLAIDFVVAAAFLLLGI